MSLNASTIQSQLYRPQMASAAMLLFRPKIHQQILKMPPVRPTAIRPQLGGRRQHLKLGVEVKTK